MRTRQYKDRKYVEVETAEPRCDGCMFEAHVFEGDCLSVHKRPECHYMARKDGKSVIFKEVKLTKNRK